jgi:hypothetical protein
MAWDYSSILFAVLLLPELTFSAPSCDLSVLRNYNRAAELAFKSKEMDVQSDAKFHGLMHKILTLNVLGCYLPRTDPDSVLFRSKRMLTARVK